MSASPLGSSNSDSPHSGPMSEINITPFVDVVLVLLVIFIVTAPTLMKDAIGIDLPKSSSGDTQIMKSIGVAVGIEGQLWINGVRFESTVDAETELKRLKTAADQVQMGSAQAILSADQEAKHSFVVKAIDLVKRAGIQKFAIQIEREAVPPTPSAP